MRLEWVAASWVAWVRRRAVNSLTPGGGASGEQHSKSRRCMACGYCIFGRTVIHARVLFICSAAALVCNDDGGQQFWLVADAELGGD